MTTVPIAVPETGEHAPIRTFADILRALSQDPALAEALRQHVLDDELRRLPAAFQRLAATVEEYITQTNRILAELRAGQARHDADIAEVKESQARLEEGQARHDADIAELKAGQARLEEGQARHDADIAEIKAGQARLEEGQARHDADIAEIKAGQRRHDADINELKAKFLPFDARKMIGVIAGRLNIRRPVWLDNTVLLEISDAAGDLADAVPDNELQSFYAIDLALQAVGKAEQDTQYVVIECSNTVDRNDILRIRRNADLMAHFTGYRTHAIVIGNRLPERIAAEADAHGVLALQPGGRVTRAT